MKRHTSTLDASTSVGGKLVSASSTGNIKGIPIALEGDVISCPACKSQGKIKCIGPRIPETWNGKNVALENDLCMCNCPNPPHLLPSQSLRYQAVGETESSLTKIADSPLASGLAFDDRFILVDEETNEPLAATEYALKRANGKFEFGTTDEKGHTHLLAATAHFESVEIYL